MKDAEYLKALTDDTAITSAIDFLPSPFTAADAIGLVSIKDDDNCLLGVWHGATMIGVVGVHVHGVDRLEIGYWIGSHFQRRGYATEAVSAVIARLRRTYADMKLTAECRPENDASWALLHKLGFHRTGRRGERPGRELLALPKV